MLKISCRCQVYISAFNQRAGYLKQIVLERKRCFYEWMSLWGRVCASLIGSAGCEYTEVRGRADVTLISLSGPEPEPEPWHQDKRVISWTRALRWLRPFDLLHVFIGSFTCDVFWLLHTGVFLPALINNLAAVVCGREKAEKSGGWLTNVHRLMNTKQEEKLRNLTEPQQTETNVLQRHQTVVNGIVSCSNISEINTSQFILRF